MAERELETRNHSGPREDRQGATAERRPTPRVTSPANLLGLGRILATPVVMILMLAGFPGSGAIAAAIFAVAAVTDYFDGRVARARGEVSPLGVFMDLTADKVLVAGVLITMVEVDLLPAWMVAVILVRELVIAGVRQMRAAAQVVVAAAMLGKVKTAATLAAMAVLLLAFDARTGGPLAETAFAAALEPAGLWLMVAAVALTVASGFAYLRGAWPMLSGRD